jgi:hypothetical protein
MSGSEHGGNLLLLRGYRAVVKCRQTDGEIGLCRLVEVRYQLTMKVERSAAAPIVRHSGGWAGAILREKQAIQSHLFGKGLDNGSGIATSLL